MHISTQYNIAGLRKKKNMTQQQLANATGVTREHIAKVEKNRERASGLLLENIAKVLSCKVKELYKDI